MLFRSWNCNVNSKVLVQSICAVLLWSCSRRYCLVYIIGRRICIELEDKINWVLYVSINVTVETNPFLKTTVFHKNIYTISEISKFFKWFSRNNWYFSYYSAKSIRSLEITLFIRYFPKLAHTQEKKNNIRNIYYLPLHQLQI